MLRERNTDRRNIERILGSDKDNFFIRNEDIVRVDLYGSEPVVRIILLTKDDKLEFTSTGEVDSMLNIFAQVLGDKVSAPH